MRLTSESSCEAWDAWDAWDAVDARDGERGAAEPRRAAAGQLDGTFTAQRLW